MKKGFSLIEMIFVLAVMGIMVFIASASFLNLAPKYRLKRAAWEINSCLNLARYKAIFEGVPTRVLFDASSYRVEKFDASQKTWHPLESNLLEGVVLQANNSPTFYPVGTVSNLATINIFNYWGRYKITIAITGRIKIVLI
jgi:type II secretion system protein H